MLGTIKGGRPSSILDLTTLLELCPLIYQVQIWLLFLLWLDQSYAPLIEKCQICDFCALKLMYLTTIHKSSLNELCPLIN